MTKPKLFAVIILLFSVCFSYGNGDPKKAEKKTADANKPIVVTEDNFPTAYSDMRFAALVKQAGGVNKFLKMPNPPSDPAKQFVVRMNRDTPYSGAVVDMSSGKVYITVPKTKRYVSIQVVDHNHETQPMIYGPGRHKITAKTDYAFVIVRTLEGKIRDNLV